MSLYENSTVDDLRARVAKLQEQIDKRHDEIDRGVLENTSGNKGAITRWENEIKLLLPIIMTKCTAAKEEARRVAKENSDRRLEAELEVIRNRGTVDSKPDVSGQSRLRDYSMNMSRDILSQPMLDPTIDVAVFCRHMSVVYHTHCTKMPELETDFMRVVEQRLCAQYRRSYQMNTTDKPIETWAEMEKYLLRMHKSSSTIFQELATVEGLHMGATELLRDYAARLKTVGGDTAVIVKAKFLEMNKREPTVDDMFELFMSNTLIKQMMSHSVYSSYFDQIVKDLDTAYRVEDVAAKASLLADRQVKANTTVTSESRVYMASQTPEVTLDTIKETVATAMRSFAAGQKRPSSTSDSDGKKKKTSKKYKTFRERCEKDKEYCDAAKDKPCRNEADNGSCTRGSWCPFKHSQARGGGVNSSMLASLDSSYFH